MHLLEIHEPGQTPKPHEKDNAAVGIDLGTTNSLVAVSSDGKPEIVRSPDGAALLPSVVAYLNDGGILVGEDAHRHLLDEPDQVISSVKRLMGRGAEDVKSLAGSLPYELVPGPVGEMVKVHVGGRTLSPVEISGQVLKVLRTRAEGALGHDVVQAVVTVPAYFDDAARTATRDAARLAGLEVLRLVNEPTAAALAYGLDSAAEGLYAVFDLGGGTFDISILRMQKGVFQVLATGGDAVLGGDDFDHAIAEHLLSQRAEEYGTANLETGEVKRALATARLAKECLTTQGNGTWVLDINDQQSRHVLDVETFEKLIDPMVEQAMDVCRWVMEDAEASPSDIRGVVLVGGSTRVPLVRRRVAELFGQEPLSGIDPDQVVALGAALQAEALTRGSDTLLLDVTPLSLGIETMGGLVEKVIPRNTSIPVSRAQEFTTYQDGQTGLAVHVVQGEREMADENRSLARFELHGIPGMTAGAARIKVIFVVDADGLLTVSAREDTTGVEQLVEVKPSYGLSDEDMAGMLRAAMEHAQDDMEWRLLTETRVEAERLASAVRAAMAADSDLLSNEETGALVARLNELDNAVSGEDRNVIAERVRALDQATQAFASRRMDRGMDAALKGVEIDRLEDRVVDDDT